MKTLEAFQQLGGVPLASIGAVLRRVADALAQLADAELGALVVAANEHSYGWFQLAPAAVSY